MTRVVGWLAAALVCLALGVLVTGDRPGLEADYFPLTISGEGGPWFSRVEPPQAPAARPTLFGGGPFSIRWRGTIAIHRPGVHRFRLETPGEASLTVAGREPSAGEIERAAGHQSLEIGLTQRRGEPRLTTLWTPPGGTERTLEGDALFARAPGPPRRWLRHALAGLPLLPRRLAGAALLLAALLLARRALARPATRSEGSPHRLVARLRPPAELLLLAGAALAAYRWGAAAAGAAYGGALAASVAALVFGVRALGPPLPLGTLGAALLLLASQSQLVHSLGLYWPGYAAMPMVTAAVALSLHRISSHRPPRRELGALAIGALTVAALRAHPTGAVLAWLLLPMLWTQGRLDPRGFLRKLGYWAAGALLAHLALEAAGPWLPLDAPLGALDALNREAAAGVGWTRLFWTGPPEWPHAGGALRVLGLLALGAAFVASASGRPLELRLLHLLPMAGLLLLVVRSAVVPRALLPLDLVPIVPAACLLGAALFHYWGLDEIDARRLASPPVLAGGLAVVTLALVVVMPYAAGELDPRSILPLDVSSSAAGRSVERTVVPGLTLLGLALAALAAARRSARLPLLITACALFLAPALAETRHALATRWGAQREARILHPWTTLAKQLELDDATRILVRRRLVPRSELGMFGSRAICEAVARAHFDAPGLEIALSRDRGEPYDYLVTTQRELRSWGRKGRRARRHMVEDEATGMILVDANEARLQRSGKRGRRPARAAAERELRPPG